MTEPDWSHHCNEFHMFEGPPDAPDFWAIYDHHPGHVLHAPTRRGLYVQYVRVHQQDFPDCLNPVYLEPFLDLHLALQDFRDVVIANVPLIRDLTAVRRSRHDR
jgi:hypothetical protein